MVDLFTPLSAFAIDVVDRELPVDLANNRR